MHGRTRLYLMHTPMQKTVAEQLAELEDELSPSTLTRWPLIDAAPQGGIWMPDKRRRVSQLVQEVQCG